MWRVVLQHVTIGPPQFVGHDIQGNELRRSRRPAMVEPADQRVVASREVGGFKGYSIQVPNEILRVAGLLAFAITDVLATDEPTIGDSSETL